MPFLREKINPANKDIRAVDMMTKDVVWLYTVANMLQVKEALSSKHSSFPVLN